MRTVVAIWLVLLPGAASPSAEASSREPRFLNFWVRDRHDIYVRDLDMEEVELKLDGQPTDIRYFGYRNVSTTFAVVLENSPRTAQYAVSQPQLGQTNLIDRVRYLLLDDFFGPITAIGPCLLAQFDREVEPVQHFTSDPDLLINAVHRIKPQPRGLTVDYIEVGRVIARAADLLQQRDERRKILILFASTIDRQSYNNMQEYQDMLRLFDVELFVVSFAPRTNLRLGASFEEKNNAYFFKRLAGETAGKAVMTGEYTYLEELFTELKGQIMNYYTVGFYVDAAAPATEHEVELSVDRKKARVTHRKVLIY